MMKVTVKFYATLRDLIGKKEPIDVELEKGATISKLLDELYLDSGIKETMIAEDQKVKPDITILINGREIKFLNGIETKLSSGDEISIFPLVAGG
ncbi:MAG: ubiquitin-like small modifier protein 1 [Promethearchaeota archaeon]